MVLCHHLFVSQRFRTRIWIVTFFAVLGLLRSKAFIEFEINLISIYGVHISTNLTVKGVKYFLCHGNSN